MAYNMNAGMSNAAAGAAAGSSFGPWGAAIGGTIGALGGFGSSKRGGTSAKTAALLAQYQAQQEERRMKNAHQWEVQDLIKAGLNPALSATGSSAGAIAGHSSQAGNVAANVLGTAENARSSDLNRNIQSAATAAEVFNKIRDIENRAGLQEAQIKNADADTTTKNLNNQLVKKYGDKRQKIELANEILKGEEIKAKTAQTRSMTEKIRQDIGIDAPQEYQNRDLRKLFEENPKAARTIQYIDMLLERGGKIGGFISGILGGKAAISAASNLGKIQRIEYYNRHGEFTGMREKSYR
nr:MAG TPA: minor capsid protein [Microviridae sp.]